MMRWMILALMMTTSSAWADSCDRCHTSSGWSFASFNHAKTAYPLEGSHRVVPCKACHEGGDYEKDLNSSCGSCHRDVHAAELGQECKRCHDETSWRNSFVIDSHRRTNFPLIGRHALIPCEECHGEMREKTFARATVACYSCHAADYAATASSSVNHVTAGFSTRCESCHQPVRWTPARFAQHDACFPISGGEHAGISCLQCHTSLSSVVATGACATGTYFCGACHTGAHSQSRMNEEHSGVAGYQYTDQKCYECHTQGN